MDTKKWLKIAAIAFVVWYAFKQPGGAADTINGVLGAVGDMADSLATIVNQVDPSQLWS